MKVLLISPLGFAIHPETRYAGVERLVWEYSRELSKTHEVTVMGREDSIYSEAVKVLPISILDLPDTNIFGELKSYQIYQSEIRKFDVIHDFSHQHLASRFMPALPSLNIFWHAPALAQYPKSPYNVIALSQWASREFKRIYKQEAKYQQSIVLDTTLYKLTNRHRGDRFLAVGRMGKDKGNLNAAMLCKKLGVPLDIITAPCGEPDYEKAVQELADGKQIKIWWEQDYTEASKIEMMQTCKALLYVTDNPEVTSHKIQESLICGAPVVVPNLGAIPEIVTHGVDGYLCRTEAEFVAAMGNVHKLSPLSKYEETKKRYSVENVVKNYLPLYESVAGGLRW